MTTVNAIDNAKEAYKAALLKQAEPINTRITELKTELASLETQKRILQDQQPQTAASIRLGNRHAQPSPCI